MTDPHLWERLRQGFGNACREARIPRWLLELRRDEVCDHQKWVRSDGRFRSPLAWKNLTGCFKRTTLHAEDFSQVVIDNCHFKWFDLRCVSFVGTQLKNVIFEKYGLELADFNSARLENVSFIDCFDVDQANFNGAVFSPSDTVLDVISSFSYSRLMKPAHHNSSHKPHADGSGRPQ